VVINQYLKVTSTLLKDSTELQIKETFHISDFAWKSFSYHQKIKPRRRPQYRPHALRTATAFWISLSQMFTDIAKRPARMRNNIIVRTLPNYIYDDYNKLISPDTLFFVLFSIKWNPQNTYEWSRRVLLLHSFLNNPDSPRSIQRATTNPFCCLSSSNVRNIVCRTAVKMMWFAQCFFSQLNLQCKWWYQCWHNLIINILNTLSLSLIFPSDVETYTAWRDSNDFRKSFSFRL
jgi:hypothetical protein